MSFARDLADLGRSLDTSSLSFRNMVINGAMMVAQRGTSLSGLSTGSHFLCDRFVLRPTNLGAWTLSQSTNAPDEFTNSMRIECTTADVTPAAGDQLTFETRLIGRDLQRLKKGLTSAKSVTLQKWVRSNKTGTYQVNLRDFDNSRQISATYTINSVDTWQQIVLTFEGDTTGPFVNDNSIGLIIEWVLSAGTDFTSGTLQTSWAPRANTDTAVGVTVNLADTVGNYFEITGVQLEEGEEATPFEHMSYDEHLHRCLPYYWRLKPTTGLDGICVCYFTTTTVGQGIVNFPVPMISAPHTFEQTGTASDYSTRKANTGVGCSDVPTSSQHTETSANLVFTASTFIAGEAGVLRFGNNLTTYLAWSAEL